LSGIHGVLRFDGVAVRESDLLRQANALSHRGPDRRASWRDGPMGLGHLLMRVTPEDGLEAQPLRQGPLVLVADARLDNREELARDLGIDAQALPDSALILKAWIRWGADSVERLLGDFAFALWDGHALTLARDHMGQRHVHYHAGPDFFAFASEIRGLRALADVPQALDEAMLARRLAVDRTPTRGATVFQGIFGLEGGTVMRVAASGEIATRRYWTPQAGAQHLNRDEDYYVRTYRAVLAEAVGCRVRRAQPRAALLLGGGFDSGAIAGLSGEALPAGRKLVCVASVGADPDRGVRKWTGILARKMPHLDVRLMTRDGIDALTGLERNFLQDGEPYSPNRYASQALVEAAAATGARVIMDGHGGDYTLNPRGTGWLARRLLRGEIACFLRELRAYRRHGGASLAHAVRSEIVAPLVPGPIARLWRRWRAGLPFSGPAAPINAATTADPGVLRRSGDPLPQMAEVLRRQQSGHVVGGALLAAAHGMEFTQPYHDKRVVELALAIPEQLHVRDGRDRHLARLALADVYPPEFARRGRENDPLIPDFVPMAARIAPQMLAEIDRLENNPRLARLFDFVRMRRMLAPGAHETALRHAVRAFLHARFVEWQDRGNRPS
jgi:asparagine synthase (glutamine-hydrolysing)